MAEDAELEILINAATAEIGDEVVENQSLGDDWSKIQEKQREEVVQEVNRELELHRQRAEHLITPMSSLSTSSISRDTTFQEDKGHSSDSGLETNKENVEEAPTDPVLSEILRDDGNEDAFVSDTRHVIQRIPRRNRSSSRERDRDGYFRTDHRQ